MCTDRIAKLEQESSDLRNGTAPSAHAHDDSEYVSISLFEQKEAAYIHEINHTIETCAQTIEDMKNEHEQTKAYLREEQIKNEVLHAPLER